MPVGIGGAIIRSYGATVGPLTLYLKNSAASGSSHGSLQDGGTGPSVATTTTAWSLSTAGTTYAEQVFNSTVSTWGTTVLPSGAPSTTDCWRTENTYSGTIKAGTWTLAIALIGTAIAANGTVNYNLRLWRSINQNGSSATEITSGVTSLTTAANPTNVQVNTTGTVVLGAITLSNEYIFLQLAMKDVAGVTSNGTISLVVDANNSRIITP